MGQAPSRDPRDSDVAERGCRNLLPCFRPRVELPLPFRPNNGAIPSTRSDLFQSCDDLSDVASAAMFASRPERLAQECGLTLRTLRQMPELPPAAVEACERVAQDLVQLEAVLANHALSGTQSCASNSAVELGESTGGVVGKGKDRSVKDKLQKVIHAVELQRELGIQPGSLASGLNQMISILWPRIGTYVEELIHTSIEPSINASLPGMLKGGVKFTKVSLGQSSPLLGPITVEENQENGAITMHVGVDFKSNLDIELAAMGIPIGISEIFLKGDLHILFTPPMTKPPFFGGVQVYFPNPPDVGLNFVGAARVADVPGLRSSIRGSIDGAVAGVCVLPRRIAVDMNAEDDIDIVDLMYPEPIGILRLTLWSGAKLVASDVNLFGADTSDPYVVASLGIKTWTSPHVSKCLNPEWGDGAGLTVDFPVHDECQALSLKIFDYDFGTSDDLIGVAKSGGIRDLVAGGPRKQTIEVLTADGEVGGGTLTISAAMLSLTPDEPSVLLAMSGPSEAHLSAKVTSIKGLKEGAEYPFKVRIQLVKADGQGRSTLDRRAAEVSGVGSQSWNMPTKASKNVSAKLKASRTMALGSASKMQMIAEGSTRDSHPKEHGELSEALQGIARQLALKHLPTAEIAEILDVGPRKVGSFMKMDAGADKAREQQAQQEFMSVRHPRFEEVVQFLLPCDSVDDLAVLQFDVLDKRQRILATASVPMPHLLETPQLLLEGPFDTDVEGVQIVGSLRLRWLA